MRPAYRISISQNGMAQYRGSKEAVAQMAVRVSLAPPRSPFDGNPRLCSSLKSFAIPPSRLQLCVLSSDPLIINFVDGRRRNLSPVLPGVAILLPGQLLTLHPKPLPRRYCQGSSGTCASGRRSNSPLVASNLSPAITNGARFCACWEVALMQVMHLRPPPPV